MTDQKRRLILGRLAQALNHEKLVEHHEEMATIRSQEAQALVGDNEEDWEEFQRLKVKVRDIYLNLAEEQDDRDDAAAKRAEARRRKSAEKKV
jgi:hypothetical protein